MWKKSSEQVHNLFHFLVGTTHICCALGAGVERGGGHVFLLRCGSLICVSVTAYIVSAS